MKREDCRIGMPVFFGRPNGEKTKGTVEKMNLKSAKVRTSESRGVRTTAGAIWTVHYGLMTEDKSVTSANPTQNIAPNPAPAKVLKFNPFSDDNLILEAMLQVYSDLSPENISADGERSMSEVRRLRTELDRKLRGLQTALGYTVDEIQIYQWYESKNEYNRAKAAEHNENPVS